mmetsp:Transcript_18650/g.43607  ORF Transcript_18650/g.43607 Transcript_18650/m.43607 type:complete len:460 (+) Transcript_18650:51-1430(+)
MPMSSCEHVQVSLHARALTLALWKYSLSPFRVWLETLVEILAVLSVCVAAWLSTWLLLFPAAIVMVTLAACRAKSLRQFLPLFVIIPEGQSAWGTSRDQRPAVAFTLVRSLVLAVTMLTGFIIFVLITMGPLSSTGNHDYDECMAQEVSSLFFQSQSCSFDGPEKVNSSHYECRDVPLFLEKACEHRRFWIEVYHICQSSFPRIGELRTGTACTFISVQFTILYEGGYRDNIPWELMKKMVFVPMLSLVLLLLANFLCCAALHRCPGDKEVDEEWKARAAEEFRTLEQEMVDGGGRLPWLPVAKCRFVMDAALLALEVFMHLYTASNYFRAKAYYFAAVQALIFVVSLGQPLFHGGWSVVVTEFRNSLQIGVATDAYLRMVQFEKTVVAPVTLFIQYFAIITLSQIEVGFYMGIFSLLVNILTVTQAAYQVIHLDIFFEPSRTSEKAYVELRQASTGRQ